ncbi:MAG: UPF0182 family protein [Acidimicrobiales bacterium]|nr:UPF0182 family protein [Acidimicrobiales bacterium]
MRTPSDLPASGRSRRLGDRGRVALITVAVVLIVLVLSARFLSGFYIDYLWHSSVGRGDVFWGQLLAKLTLFGLFGAVFIAIAVLNLVIADRLAPLTFSANMHPVVERFHDLFGRRLRLLRILVAVFFGLLFALPATGQWSTWLLFRNSKSFGIDDPQFGNDIGFYVFRLPFITFALDWLFAALVFVTILVILTHVLNGGVVLQPPKPKVRRATKAHVAVLLALLAVVKAGDYWVLRYELTNERRGFVQGATYSVVNAQLPAVVLLSLIALLVAALFLSTLKTDTWRLPILASALWAVIALVGGVIYPAAVQALVVNPNQKDREAVYIERNITATRQALDIADIDETVVEFNTLTAGELTEDIEPLQNVRLLNPGQLIERFRADEGQRAGLTIRDLDIDRYEFDGREQQVMVAARELDLGTIANKSWQGRHLISTHGCGLVVAPVNRVNSNGRPDYQSIELSRPELYFSEGLDGYSIVRTSVSQETCQGVEENEYSGQGGILLDSVFKRTAFALNFLDYNLLGSSAITDESRIFWIRNVRERVEKVAPFLSFDADPYPVAVEGGVLWVVDGYTTSDRFPYAQNANTSQLTGGSGLDFPFNYIRNSVKAVVNAYDGSMQFYVADPDDPIINAWADTFPDLFAPLSAMPAELQQHLRYPEDLFRVQTEAYSKYRLDGDRFFDRKDAWSVSQAPSSVPRAQTTAPAAATDAANAAVVNDFAEESGSARFVPYYSMFRAPGQDEASFQMVRPFVPFSTDDTRRELSAFMVASSEPETYGQMTAYVLPDTDTDGPALVQVAIDSDPRISAEITLLDTAGSSVVFGDMQLVPIGDGLLYLRPMYIRADNTLQATFRYMVAVYNGTAVFGADIQEALAKLFGPAFRTDVGDVLGAATPDDEDEPDTPATERTIEELLSEAEDLFTQADIALQSTPPDFARYDELSRQARDLVTQALELSGNG